MIAADISFWTVVWYAFAGLVSVCWRGFHAGQAEYEYRRDDLSA